MIAGSRHPGRLQPLGLTGKGEGSVSRIIYVFAGLCVCVLGVRGAARRHTLALPTLPPPRALRLSRWYCQRSALARGMRSGTICEQRGSLG